MNFERAFLSAFIGVNLCSFQVHAGEWSSVLADAKLQLSLKETKSEILSGEGLRIISLEENEAIQAAAISSNRTQVLVLIVKKLSSPKAKVRVTTYSRLILFSKAADHSWSARSILSHQSPPMNIRERWIRDVRSIADDGKFAEVHLGQQEEENPAQMVYEWRKIDLLSEQL